MTVDTQEFDALIDSVYDVTKIRRIKKLIDQYDGYRGNHYINATRVIGKIKKIVEKK
ncbi:MAG: hypothetical protein ACXAD7_28120 [Candidatus Kariarchaeaceae archaeon]|jgi:hypothetical protein